MNSKIKRLISGMTAFALSATMLASFPAFADEPERYPYTLFAGSDKDGAITINTVWGGCINGNIATNGTINSDENINFNGNKYENAKIETINISQKLRDEYFSSEDISRFAEDYELSEMNINLKIPLDVQGDINLSGNVNSNTEIFALENIKLNGESLNANNSVIYSQLGDVDIDFSNVNFSGLIYAPNGDVEISGQGINLNNVVIIADAITLDGQYININYSSSFAESVGAQLENNNDSSGESSSRVDDNSSETENSQIEESSSVTDSSESDDTSSDEDSSMIDSSQADESSSVSDSSSIDDSSKPDDSSSEDTDMLDDDGDGLVNAYEKMLGTDKDNPDTDGDGLTDWQEVVFTGTDPLKFDSVTEGISDAKADSDGDGLSNAKEIELGTNSQNVDTDSDGLSDYDEINVYGTNPIKKDTDDDGIEDWDEVKLGLDPKSSASDGTTPDSERTFSQHIDAEAENFKEINTDDNPFDVSMDITATGSAISNLKSYESGYSNAIKSDMTLGITPEFTYSEGLKVEDVTINFALKSEAVNEANENNDSVNDNLKGLKRYSVFKYFEDIDMLLPIETSYDESNNILSVHVDELGTYCVMDMQQWFKQLGVDTSKTVQPKAPARKMMSVKKAVAEIPDQEATPNIDVVFNVFLYNGAPQRIADEIITTGEKLFEEYGDGGNVHIYVVSYLGGATKVPNEERRYATNLSELEEMISRIPRKQTSGATMIEDSVTRFLRENELRNDADKYYVSVQGSVVESKRLQSLSERFVRENITAIVVTNHLLDDTKMIADMTGGLYYDENICMYGEPVADYIITFHKMKGDGKVYRTILPTGWKVVALDADITKEYKQIADRGVTDEDRLKYADQDNDGLLDLEELRYTYGENQIIRWDKDGKVVLPTFQDCFNFFSDKSYMINPLAQYASMDLSAFDEWRILPIKSDPCSYDSDNDGLDDALELEVGTKVLSTDTDEDRLDDGIEVLEMYDPLNSNPDGDSYDDLEEYRYGTSPYTYDLDYEEWHCEFLIGFFGGDFVEAEYIPTMLGQITSGFVPVVADLRDTIANISKRQWGSAALSALGLIPAAGDAAKIAGNVGQFITKHAKDASSVVSAVVLGAKEAPDVLKHLPSGTLDDLEKGISKVKNMSKTDCKGIKNAGEAIGKNFDELLSPEVKKAEELASRVGKHGDDFAKIANKCGDAAAEAVKKLSPEDASEFLKVFTKQTGNVDFFKALKNSVDPEKAVKFLADYGEDAAEIFGKYGDNVVEAVTKCDAPYKAIAIIKHGGEQYGELAAQAIKKSGDKAVEALTKVPSKKCAELIAEYGDDATGVIKSFGKDAVTAIDNCTNKSKAIDFIKQATGNYGKNAVDLVNKHGEKAIDAVMNITTKTNQKKCVEYILDYGDDATEIFTKYGDDACKGLNQCTDKAAAINIIKENGGASARYLERNSDEGVERFLYGKYGVYENVAPLPDDFPCINAKYADSIHPDSGVPYVRKQVTIGGKTSEVVVPKFNSEFDTMLPDDMLKSSDKAQFKECNLQLNEAISKDPILKSKFNDAQLEQIANGENPDGFTWHHNEGVGKMQLVDFGAHGKSSHTGGRAMWGGGQDAR